MLGMEAQGLCSHLFSPLIDIVIVMTVSISGLKQLYRIAIVPVIYWCSVVYCHLILILFPDKKLFYDLGSLLSTAVRKEDERIVSCLRGSDAVAKEVRYHPSCFRSYCFDTEYKTNRYLLPFRTFNSLVVLGRFLALFHRIVR